MKKSKILIGGGYKHPALKNCIRVTIGSKKQMARFMKEFLKK
jgi:histidinol-phosphate/aromatic aminotransferase/cobyric acid decarboxylase-like protein